MFPLIKKPGSRGWSKNYLTKKCALNQGEEKLILEEDAFFIKDKKVISAKFSVNISRRLFMYVMFYHYIGNLWNSATFARFRNFRNFHLRELTRTIAGLTALS